MDGWFQWLLSTFPYLLVGGLAAGLLADDLGYVSTASRWIEALP